MSSSHTVSVRLIAVSIFVCAALFASPPVAAAQGFGVGGRMAWIKADSDADDDSVRFTGGQIRLLGGRWGLEVSMDRRSDTFDTLNQKVTQTPIQASLLLRMGSRGLAPYLLGGPGWYRQTVKPIDGSDDDEVKTREFGWHAGGGLEILAGRRIGIHGDYRYTFLGDDDEDEDEDDGIIGSLLPGHRGSMWTLGVTIYF